MGNNRSEVEIAIKLDKQFYYAGDTLNGKIYLNPKKQFACSMIVLSIKGSETNQFQTQTNQAAKTQNSLLNTDYVLHQFPLGYKIKQQLQFPFNFKFPAHLPGSYSETKQYKAKIAYSLKVTLKPPSNKSPIQNQIQVAIRQPQKDQQTMLFGQCFTHTKCCGCIDRGVSRVTCYFEKKFYFPTDECIIICEADNLKSKASINRINCQFVKMVTLTSQFGAKKVYSQVLNVLSFPGVGGGQAYTGQYSQRNHLKLIYKDNKAGVHPTTNGKFVKCQYFVLVKPQFGGCCISTEDNEFKVQLNILQPAMIYEAIPQPDTWRPSIIQNSNIYLQFNKKNDMLSSMDNSQNQ